MSCLIVVYATGRFEEVVMAIDWEELNYKAMMFVACICCILKILLIPIAIGLLVYLRSQGGF